MTAPKGKIYFAHPISSYNGAEEAAVIQELTRIGYDVVNPNADEHKQVVKTLQDQFNTEAAPKAASPHIMEYFVKVCNSCDVCAVMPFPNGKFGAGVVKEANSFFERGAKVLEVTVVEGAVNVRRLTDLPPEHCLSVDETRAMLAALNTPGYARAPTPKNP